MVPYKQVSHRLDTTENYQPSPPSPPLIHGIAHRCLYCFDFLWRQNTISKVLREVLPYFVGGLRLIKRSCWFSERRWSILFACQYLSILVSVSLIEAEYWNEHNGK